MQIQRRMLIPVLSLVFSIITVPSVGCGRADSPQSLAEHAKVLGVYVSSPDGLRDLGVFGVEEHNILAETMTFKFNDAIPTLKNTPQYFVVNMPNANITDSKVFWLPNLKNSQWHYFHPNDERDPKPIKTSVEPITTGIYKVSPVEYPVGQHGFLCLWLKMAMGTPDRMYALEIGS
jgi:hypothetical protein